MLKSLFRHFLITILALYLTSQFLVKGFIMPLNLIVYLKISLLFSLLSYSLKPVLKIIFLPLNFLTLGLFFWFLNAVILYLLKILSPEISFVSTPYPSFSASGLTIPKLYLSPFWTLVASSVSLSLISKFFHWLSKK